MESENFDIIYGSMKQTEERLNEITDFNRLISNNEIKTLLLINHIINIENNQNQIVELLETNEQYWRLRQLPSIFISLTAMVIASIAIFKEPDGLILIIFSIFLVGAILILWGLSEKKRVNEYFLKKR